MNYYDPKVKPVKQISGLDDKPEDEVEKILQEAQKNKKHKDTGRRVRGSAKERAAIKKIITAADLEDIEKDQVMADSVVVKDKVWPKYVPDQEIDKGITSGCAFLKHSLRAAYPAKPAKSDEYYRAVYVGFANQLREDLEECASAIDVKTSVSNHYYVQTGSFIMSLISPAIAEKYKDLIDEKFSDYKVRWMVAEIFSKRFANALYYLKNIYQKAIEYEGITEEESKQIKEKLKANYQRDLKINNDKIERIKNLKPHEIKKERKNWRNVSRYNDYDFIKVIIAFLERRIRTLTTGYQEQLKKAEPREPDWSWAGKKEKGKVNKTTDLVINEGKPLEFIKRTGGLEIKNVSTTEIIKNFGFTGVELGNYVRDNEAQEHIRHFLAATADMFELIDINPVEINNLGQLAISFGSRGRGKAGAAYWPGYRIINLTKNNGDGAVAHEWAHYIDNLIFQHFYSAEESRLNKPYYSKIVSQNFDSYASYQTMFDTPAKKAFAEIIRYIFKGEDKEGEKIKVTQTYYKPARPPRKRYYLADKAENIADAVQALWNRHIMMKNIGYYRNNEREVKGFMEYCLHKFNLNSYTIERFLPKNSSQFYHYSAQMKSPYWSAPFELFARAFETYMYDKLEKAGRFNNYLVSGEYFNYYAKVYPFGAEREKLFELFDVLWPLLRDEMKVKKFKPFTTKRVDEYIELDNAKKTVKRGVVAGSVPDIIKNEMLYFKKIKNNVAGVYGTGFNGITREEKEKIIINN